MTLSDCSCITAGCQSPAGTLFYKLIVDEDNQLLEVVRGNLTTTSAAAATIADFDGDGAPVKHLPSQQA